MHLNYFFDSYFYFFYVDFVVHDANNLVSPWSLIRGVFDDQSFISKSPLTYDYYPVLRHKKFMFFDFIAIIFNKVSLIFADLKSIFLVSIVAFFYIITTILVGYRYGNIIKVFLVKDKNLNYIHKFKFYFYKKYITKKIIYGTNY